ncbi:two-component system activity regulator YycH [Alkalihalobacillus oceani]|uniref:YycH family regulatory protein n=1 Tax=Halalkalibacter oceani TaxID=1653776 RepID=UPI00203ED2B1|nr:two-component system activity regulator YycH [Halalkalibacter oceani]MCM3762813.1 two-component system activity regulator YycH [Halalkalibacter oceani]
MNYEHIKTGLLIGLIALSMVLTWKLWTFQPNFALLDETTRYVSNETMSEERRLTDLILPEQMIIHYGDQKSMIPRQTAEFEELYQGLLNASLDEGEPMSAGPFPKEGASGGIEFVFPASLPIDIFLGLFQVDREEMSIPITAVNRLYIYIDEQSEQVRMQLLSSEDEPMVELDTTLAPGELEETVVRGIEEYPAVTSLSEMDETLKSVNKAIYFPDEPLTAERLSFTISPIPGAFFRQSLFTDPASVKYYRQSGSEESYTDGNRIININNNGLFMEYNNPIFTGTQERSSKHIILSSYEFINGHGGWSDQYLLSRWVSTDARDEAEYRMHVNDLPVISFQGLDQMKLTATRSGNQIESYARPLFDLDSSPIDARQQVELPSGEQLLERLRDQEYFDFQRLQKVTVGYEMIMPNPSFVTVNPYWFILYDNHWQKVTFNEEEGETDGLE